MVPLRTIKRINQINNRTLGNRINEDPREDPQEEVEMTLIEEVVEMVEDRTVATEGEIEEIATHRTLL